MIPLYRFHKWYDRQREAWRLAVLIGLCSPLFVLTSVAEELPRKTEMLAILAVAVWMLFLLVSRMVFLAKAGQTGTATGASTAVSASKP